MDYPKPRTQPDGADRPGRAPLLPNALSLARLGLTPVIFYCLHRDGGTASSGTVVLLLIAIATDALDGMAARRLGQISRLGRILDPLADKVLVAAAGVALVLWYGFPIWLIALQVARDLAILGAGGFLLRSRHLVEAASRPGKAATAAMAVALLSFALGAPGAVRTVLVYATAVLLVWSSLDYIRVFARIIRGRGRS